MMRQEYKGRDVGSANLERLCGKHIQRFTDRVLAARMGQRNVREDECLHYLAIWRSIRDKECQWEKLSGAEREEILEAIDSGE